MTLLSLIDEKINDAKKCAGIVIVREIENIDILNIHTERRVCGVYIIITKRGIYIGSSIDVFKRLKKNISDGNLCKKNLDVIIRANIYITKNEYDARLLERILLYFIRPTLNKYNGPGSRKMENRTGWEKGIWRGEIWRRYKKLKKI